MDDVIDVRSLTISYREADRRVDVISDATFSVAKGEAVALVGPSGSGKSSILYTLLGMLVPSAGSVAVAGEDIFALSAGEVATLRRSRLGVIFQAGHLFGRSSAVDNVALPLRLLGTGRSAARVSATGLLERLSLGDRALQQARRLSAGEQQRVAIARAVATGPDLVLADEPTANLDRHAAKTVVELLKDVVAGRHAMLMATHDAIAAEQMDRILEIRDGTVVEAR